MMDQRQRRWPDVVQMLYNWFVFAGTVVCKCSLFRGHEHFKLQFLFCSMTLLSARHVPGYPTRYVCRAMANSSSRLLHK